MVCRKTGASATSTSDVSSIFFQVSRGGDSDQWCMVQTSGYQSLPRPHRCAFDKWVVHHDGIDGLLNSTLRFSVVDRCTGALLTSGSFTMMATTSF